jgi:hypothetical protein
MAQEPLHTTTDLIDLAAEFVNRTGRHIFLTGKAGTGKTTFLRNLAEATHKKFVVVAPTGIAALHAKGVTIHSQFLLPPGTFIPDRTPPGDFTGDQFLYSQSTLARKHPMNAVRRQVLRDIDLLIIDEVSMLRADLLDAIDYRLRSARRNFREPFGGVQLLMIGDLFQLPPVVRDNEWSHLQRYYESVHFFESRALKQAGYVYIELDRIFRQSDDRFIGLLNNLRNNCPTAEDIATLNAHFRTDEQIRETGDAVTLTTHNYKADELNAQALAALPGKALRFEATVEGDFPEGMYPVSPAIELKPGAQVMFIKNDSQNGRYFNGKIAHVVSASAADDEIAVSFPGERDTLKLTREEWENKRYTVNASTRELDEEVVGTFRQFPVRLAWAITVHKSQGLTFDRAVIDVGRAFAPGQVYVALSRLRSLDGLMLRTRIDPGVIATDPQVVDFSVRQPSRETLPGLLEQGQAEFLKATLNAAFDFDEIIREAAHIVKEYSTSGGFDESSMKSVLDVISHTLESERNNLARFRHQLHNLLETGDRDALTDRLNRGSAYYDAMLRTCMRDLLFHIEQMKPVPRTKTYLNDLADLDLLLTRKRDDIGKSSYIASCVLSGEPIDPRKATSPSLLSDRAELLRSARVAAPAMPVKPPKKKTAGKKETGTKRSTLDITLELLAQGKAAEEIARQRGLTVSTIEQHFAKGISAGQVAIGKVLTDETLAEIEHAFETHAGKPIAAIFHALGEKYTFSQLRMVQAHLNRERQNA